MFCYNNFGNSVSIWRSQLVYCLGIGILNLVLEDWQLCINSGMIVLVLKKCNARSVKLYAFSVEETWKDITKAHVVAHDDVPNNSHANIYLSSWLYFSFMVACCGFILWKNDSAEFVICCKLQKLTVCILPVNRQFMCNYKFLILKQKFLG
jgi:hypothetical protein